MHDLLKKSCFLLLFSSLFSYSLFAQQPYQLNTAGELGVIGGAAGLNGIAGYIAAKMDVLSPNDLENLNPNTIWGIDRWVTTQYHSGAKKSSDIALFSSFALPLTLLAQESARNDLGTVGLLTLETLLINSSLTNITKVSVRRTRPFVYNPDAPLHLKLDKKARYSFFSGHTSTTAALSFMTAQLHSDYSGKSDWAVWSLAAAIPAFTGIQRMRAGKHFLTDVLLGYIVGAGVGILVPSLHKL